MLTHSVEKRFLAIIIAVLLLLVAPLFVLFFKLTSDRYNAEALAYADVMLDANAKALGKPLWDFDIKSVQQITRALAASQTIVSAQVRDSSGQIDIHVPGAQTNPNQIRTLTKPILVESLDGNKQIGTITIKISSQSIFADGYRNDLSFMAIFFISVLATCTAAIMGNRHLIMRPLIRLTAAIEATKRLGYRHHVDWVSDDEMGALAANFNEMQERLAAEEIELKSAHARATEIYNRTPAMLYSVNEQEILIAVSDYWLEATGYARTEVIGKAFTEFVEPECRERYLGRFSCNIGAKTEGSVTVKFRCTDDRVMDVLILETLTDQSGDNTALALSVMTDVTELKRAELQNHIQAITDHLTGLLNRQGFEIALGSTIQQVDLASGELACLFVDLDRFKWINDHLGHAAGDTVLTEVVNRIRSQLRPLDTIARLGGDEFAILLAAPEAGRTALDVAGRISTVIDEPIDIGGIPVTLSASIGIALYPLHAENAAELLQKSDLAMYARKKNGKNGVRMFDQELADETRKRALVEQNIEAALREGWFDVHLQPIIDLGTGRVAGFEALMRMDHPIEGLLSPATIIPVAEETGSIGRVGACIFDRAVGRLAELSKTPAFNNAYVAVNFSPLQFEPALLDHMMSTLLKWGIEPRRIVVEITEVVLMHDNPVIQELLEAFCSAGFRIALDDFGTGFSSLSYLNRFPVDILKIDQSFVRALTTGDDTTRRKSQMLIEGIRTIAHQMNCVVVAEGIETFEQRRLLTDMRINAGQGYLFSRPLPIGEIKLRFGAAENALPAPVSLSA